MKSIYLGIYQLLYKLYYSVHPYQEAIDTWVQRYTGEGELFRLSKDIRAMIDNKASDLEIEEALRPDARLFLLLNLHQMIATPFLFRKSETDEKNIERLKDDIRFDIENILQEVKEKTGQAKFETNEIGTRDMMKIFSSKWDNLRISRLDLWT
jgi:hypothetical protein